MLKNNVTLITPILFCFAVFFSQSVYSQNNSASITGNLIDPNGSVITGLSTPVFMTHTGTGENFQSAVSLQGQYEISDLPAGTYDLVFPSSCCMYMTYSQVTFRDRHPECQMVSPISRACGTTFPILVVLAQTVHLCRHGLQKSSNN